MKSKNRSLTGTIATSSETAASTEITFPARLIHPPQSQIARSEDAVSNRVTQLDTWAQQLGQSFGITLTNFVLNPRASVAHKDGLELLGAFVEALAYREERVSLERRSGKWGLYFSRAPAGRPQSSAQRPERCSAPLDSRSPHE